MKTDRIGKLSTTQMPVVAIVRKARVLESVTTTKMFVPANCPVTVLDQDGERTLVKWDNYERGWIDGSTQYYVVDTMQNSVVGGEYYVSACQGTYVETGRPCILDDYTLVQVDKRDGGLVCVTVTVLTENHLYGTKLYIPCNTEVVLLV